MYIIYVAVEELTVGVSFSRATILSATAPEYISSVSYTHLTLPTILRV